MKDALNNLSKVFENRVRLGIMYLLVVNEQIDFLSRKKTLGLTDGNLASHFATLEKHQYFTAHKSFKGRKPHTTYKATPQGRAAFETHLNALEQIIKGIDG